MTYIQINPNPTAQLQVGCTTKRRAYLVTRFIPHDRVRMEYKAHYWKEEPTDRPSPKGTFSSSSSSRSSQNDPEWWIPTLQLSTAGRLESCHSYRLPQGGRISLRFSRSLGEWLGHNMDDDDSSSSSTTTTCLQMTHHWSGQHITEATVRGNLNDWKATARMTVGHQQFLGHTTTTTTS